MRGFFWDTISGFQDIGDFGGRRTYPSDINNSGHIVGYSETSKSNNSGQHAFLWKNNELIDLGTLKGPDGYPGRWSFAIAINDEGWIVGSSDYGILGMEGKIKFSKRFITKWNPSNEAVRIKIPELFQHDQVMKSLTSDGWFGVCGNGYGICNIFNNKYKNITYSFAGLANENLAFIKTGPGYLLINSKKGYEPVEVPFPKDSFWIGIGEINAMNSKGDAVGWAKNIHGENHAIILLND